MSWPSETPKFTWNKTSGCVFEYDSSTRYLSIVSAGKVVLDVIDADDVIGAGLEIELNGALTPHSSRVENEPTTETLTDRQGSAILNVYVYPRKNASWSSWLGFSQRPNPNYERCDHSNAPRAPFHRRLTLEPAEDLSPARDLVRAIRTTATDLAEKSLKYWVIVNPASGPNKNAEQIATKTVIPMLEQAGVDCTLLLTTHTRHAQQIMTESDEILDYDGVVVLGGDGILHEVLNGIRSRPGGSKLLEKLSVGIVGCGTSNGLATSITHAAGEAYGFVQDAFLIAKGGTISADLSTYQIGGETTIQYTSFLTFSWAFIADVDIDSECLRFLGETRMDIWAVWLALRTRSYKAKLSYTMEEEASVDVPDPVPSHWTVMEADFVLLWASQTTHAGKSNFHSPKSEFQDGVFQIFVIRRPISRYQLLKILLNLETGSHADLKGVEWIACKQYRLEAEDQQASHNDIDGELVESGVVHGSVLPNAVRYFGKQKA